MKFRNYIPLFLFTVISTFFTGEGAADAASRKTDDEGHVLVDLWKDYNTAKKSDLPQQQTGILENIMDQSKARNLYWDYNCASKEWYNVVTSRNWKLQDSSKTRIFNEAAAMDCPILTFTLENSFNRFNDPVAFTETIQARAAELRKSNNSAFYTELKGHAPDFIVSGVANDYEYLLWALGPYGNPDKDYSKTATALLAAELEGKYPAPAFLEFLNVLRDYPLDYTVKLIPYDAVSFRDEGRDIGDDILDVDDFSDLDDYVEYYENYNDNDDRDLSDDTMVLAPSFDTRRKALAAFSKKYEGKAVALFSDQQLLVDRAHDLYTRITGVENLTTSEDYKTLRDDCARFIARKDAFSGDEVAVAAAATKIAALIEYLDAQAIRVSASNDEITILLQNFDSVSLELYRDKELFHTAELKNPRCSYFLTDTLKYKFPDCPDGKYKIVCSNGECKVETTYTMHSVSAAYRDIDTGTGVYIADYMTGRPIPEADIEIFYDSSLLLKVPGFHFDGFTSIQELLDSVATDRSRRITVRCSYTDDNGWYRCSRDMSFWVKKDEPAQPVEPQPVKTARIFTDRSAFNPGDSVQFKLLAYNIEPDGSFSLVDEGHSLRMELSDPEGNVIDSVALTANGFGTAAGKFDLPKQAKGGAYTLAAYYRKTLLGSSRITVDEFVLPSYDLVFDKVDTPYFAGDTVSVKGRMASYSGHSLSSVKLAYEIEYYADGKSKTLSGNVVAATDGSFDIRFVAGKPDLKSSQKYYLTVKATAQNGETWSWSKTVEVNPLSSLEIKFSDNAEGSAKENNGLSVNAILRSESVAARFALDIRGVEVLPVLPVEYTVRRGGTHFPPESDTSDEESTVLSGTADSGTAFALSLEGLPSGLYTLEAKTEYLTPSGHKITPRNSATLLKVSEGDCSIPEGVAYYYKKADNGHIAAQFGSSDPERWFVVEAYSSDKELLHSEVVCIGTDSESAKFLDYRYEDSYTDAVKLQFFSFMDGGRTEYSFLYERPEDPAAEFPLSFSTFTDKALPHSECTVTLQTSAETEAVVTVFDKSTETLRSNVWTAIKRRVDTSFYVGIGAYTGSRSASTTYWCKDDFSDSSLWTDDGDVSGLYTGLTYSRGPRLMTRAMYSESMEVGSVGALPVNVMSLDEDEVEYDDEVEDGEIDISDVQVRDGMDRSSVFLPFLRSDKNGRIELSFTTSDRLSTYYVQVFAHDKQLGNAVLRRELKVSMPLELSVAQPQFLYAGDIYKLRPVISNSDSQAYAGTMVVEVYDTEDYNNAAPVAKYSKALTVGAGDAASSEFEIEVPHGISVLGLKVAFIAPAGKGRAADISDAVFVDIPVKEPVQTVVEAHSKVVSGGGDQEAVKAELAGEFTGTTAEGAEYSEVSLLDMIVKAIPERIRAEGDDVLSRSSALYAQQMAKYLNGRTGAQLDAAGESEHGGAQSDAASSAGESGNSVADLGVAGGSGSSASDSLHVTVPVSADAGELLKKVLACRNSDGGFGWYEEFKSSPILTAVVLERFAALSRRGLLPDEADGLDYVLADAVKYLDNNQFENYPLWGGALSLDQYLHVRTMYPSVAFEPQVTVGDSLAHFKEKVMDYFFPGDASKLNGLILAKARRTMASSVLSSDKGAALAAAWDLSASVKKLSELYDADMLSLSEYAVEHPSGGVYFPNAVMPFRGLLESEAYAHALLCGLFEGYYHCGRGADVKTGGPTASSAGTSNDDSAGTSGGDSVKALAGGPAVYLGDECHRIAEGLRLWLMVQKEIQQWDDDPAFLDAVCMVLDGSPETLGTKVAVLTKEYSKPVAEIAAAGNGFTVSRKFYRTVYEPVEAGTAPGASSESESGDAAAASSESKVRKVELKDGDTLNVGDKITAEYRVWNEENRSFVRLEAPRYAALRPVNQLSGYCGGFLQAIVSDVYGWFWPSAYREVKADRTILSFDVLSEENSVFTEEFYVVQAGTFSTPAVTVESVYAPHYRANDSASMKFKAE